MEVCKCNHLYGNHAGLKRWPEGTSIPRLRSCNSCICQKFELKIDRSIEITNKKECPKCGSNDIFETRSWVGEGSGKPYQPYHLGKKYHFYQCRVCNSWFLYKDKA